MVESEALQHEAPRPENVLLDPIRQAIRSFVGSVEASSKEMTVAAERFALDSAQLIRTASTAAATRDAPLTRNATLPTCNAPPPPSLKPPARPPLLHVKRPAPLAQAKGRTTCPKPTPSPQRPAVCSGSRRHQHPYRPAA